MLTVVIFIFLICLPYTVKGEKITVAVVSPEIRASLPGTACTLSLKVTNNSDQDLALTEKIILAPNWQLINASNNFTIEVGDSKIRLVSLYIDSTTAAGSKTITYQLQTQEKKQLLHSQEIAINILPRYQLTITPGARPGYVIAGKDYTVDFQVKNNSNTPLKVNLMLDEHPQLLSRLTESTLTESNMQLAPGQIKTVQAQVNTGNKKLNARITHHLYLKAKGWQGANKKVTAAAHTAVDIIPRVTGSDNPYHHLPLQLDTTFFMKNEPGLEIELESSGTLTDNEDRFIDIFLQPPAFNLNKKEFVSKQGTYQLSYRDHQSRVYVGDHKFSLSYLTEKRLQARGIEARTGWNNLNIGTYWRRQPDQNQGGALWLNYPCHENLSLHTGYLDRAGAHGRDQILTLGSKIDFTGNLTSRLEYACDVNNDKAATAYRGQVKGSINDFVYQAGYLKAEPDFPGRISDRKSYQIKLDYPVSESFSLRGKYRSTAENLDLNPGEPAPQQQVTTMTTAYNWQRTGIYLTAEQDYEKDRQKTSTFASKEDRLRLDVRYWGHQWRSHHYYQRTWTKDLFSYKKTVVDTLNLWTSYQPTTERYYRTWLQVDVPQTTGTLQGRFDITAYFNNDQRNNSERKQIQLGYYRSQSETTDIINNKYTASVILPLKEKNRGYLELTADYNIPDRGQKHFSMTASVSLSPLVEYKVPVSKREIGQIKGKIFHTVVPEQSGLAGVIVNINDATAVTDSKGQFVFPALKPGDYYLDLDQSSLPPDLITREPLPLPLTIKAEEEYQLDLEVTEKCSLQGQVLIYSPPQVNKLNDYDHKKGTIIINQGDKLSPDRGLSGLQIILTNEAGKVYQRQTDVKGQFNISDLRPGNWELTVHNQESIPDNYQLKQDHLFLQIDPGQTRDIEIRIVPIIREMELIDQGQVSYAD